MAFFLADYKKSSELTPTQLSNIEALCEGESSIIERLKEQYCEPFRDWLCTIEWKIG